MSEIEQKGILFKILVAIIISGVIGYTICQLTH